MRCECGGPECDRAEGALDEVTQFCIEEAALDVLEGDELLDELRARKQTEPAVPADVQRQIDAFRDFRA